MTVARADRLPSPQSRTPELSLIIPVYNEADRIRGGLKEILEYLAQASFTSELVIVDDGSMDATAGIAGQLVPEEHGRVVREPHRGKGGAVRAGMLKARGRHAIFLDIDLSTPLEFVEPCLSALQGGADVVIGSRRAPRAAIETHQSAPRELLGRGFSALSRLMTGVQARDFTCGFKGFTQRAAREIFGRQRVTNWSFDAELLFIAKQLKLRTVELPVRWRDDHRTKVRLGRDIIGSLAGLVRIRLNQLRGRYRDSAVDRRPRTKD